MGSGWLATTACCKPNVHRDERIAIDGVRIETGETFAVDWVKETPFLFMVPQSKSDYGGNNVMEEIAPNVFAWYARLRQGSLTVKVGDSVKAGAPIGKLGSTGPSEGPHLHLGLLDKPDPFAGRSLPFVFDSFALVGAIDFDASKGDRLVVLPDSREVRSAYPLYGGILDYP